MRGQLSKFYLRLPKIPPKLAQRVSRTVLIVSTALLPAFGPALAQVIDGSRNPELIPDSEAYVLFFLVMRTAPPPHWDFETKVNYVEPSGFTREEVSTVIRAADEYFAKIQPVDAQIKEINDANRGRNDAPDVLAQVNPLQEQKRYILQDIIVLKLHNNLSPKGILKLEDHLLRVKRGTKMWMPNTQVPSGPRPDRSRRPRQEMAR